MFEFNEQIEKRYVIKDSFNIAVMIDFDSEGSTCNEVSMRLLENVQNCKEERFVRW